MLSNVAFYKLIASAPSQLQLPLEYFYRLLFGQLENELPVATKLIKSGVRMIDIGANRGLYTYAFSSICQHIESFEPQSSCSQIIEDYACFFRKKNITVHKVALSDQSGEVKLNIPVLKGRFNQTLATGCATTREIDGEYESIKVKCARLDDYNFDNVSFIKIDVEGHEGSVIRGGEDTLRRERPIILVEIVQEHCQPRDINSVFSQITALGFQGKFLLNNQWVDLHQFDLTTHQIPDSKEYINNFFFFPL